MWFRSGALKHNIVSKRKCFRGASLTAKQYAETSKGLQRDKTANNYCPECGFRLLECAIRNQHTDMIELLLKNGAEIFRDNDIGRGIETMDALVKLGYKEVEGEFLYTSSSVGRFNVWATFSVKNRGIAIFYGGKSRMNVQGKEPDVYFAWGKASFKREGSVLRIEDGLETSLLEPAEPPYLGSKEIFSWFCNQLNEAIGLGSVVDDGFDLFDIEMALKASLDHFGRPSSQPSMAISDFSLIERGMRWHSKLHWTILESHLYSLLHHLCPKMTAPSVLIIELTLPLFPAVILSAHHVQKRFSIRTCGVPSAVRWWRTLQFLGFDCERKIAFDGKVRRKKVNIWDGWKRETMCRWIKQQF